MILLRMFQEGGFVMYGLALLGLQGLLLAITHALAAKKWSLFSSGVALSLVFAVGIAGTLNGRTKVELAVQGGSIDPAFVGRIKEVGYAEAMRPIQFATITVVLGGIFVALGEMRRRKAN